MSSNKKFLLLAVAFAAILLLASLGYGFLSKSYEPESTPVTETATSAAEEQEPIPAPDFTVLDSQGNSVSLSDHLGKPMVINFWATWCGPCTSELPAFDTAYAAYGEDIEFLMVNLTDGSQETMESVAAFLDDTGYTFPVYFDTTLSAAMTYGATSIPLTIFVYADGTLAGGYRGAMAEETLTQILDLLLQTA